MRSLYSSSADPRLQWLRDQAKFRKKAAGFLSEE